MDTDAGAFTGWLHHHGQSQLQLCRTVEGQHLAARRGNSGGDELPLAKNLIKGHATRLYASAGIEHPLALQHFLQPAILTERTVDHIDGDQHILRNVDLIRKHINFNHFSLKSTQRLGHALGRLQGHCSFGAGTSF